MYSVFLHFLQVVIITYLLSDERYRYCTSSKGLDLCMYLSKSVSFQITDYSFKEQSTCTHTQLNEVPLVVQPSVPRAYIH